DPTVIDQARQRMSRCPLLVQQRRVRGLDDVLALIRMAVVTKGCRVVILDHLGKVTGRRRDNRYLGTSEGAEELKATAFQLNVPVVALCQLNRSVENRNSLKPRLSDLRDSGRIEEEADEILFIWAEDERLDAQTLNVTLSLAKDRNGPTGDQGYVFDKIRGSFTPRPSR